MHGGELFFPQSCFQIAIIVAICRSTNKHYDAEVKIKREHVQGSASGEVKPEIEPITEETVRRMENPDKVEVCKSSSNIHPHY